MIKILAKWGAFGISFYLFVITQSIKEGELTVLDLILLTLFGLFGPLIAIPFIGECLIKVITKIERWLERYSLFTSTVQIPFRKD